METEETAGTQSKQRVTGTPLGIKASFTAAFALDGAEMNKQQKHRNADWQEPVEVSVQPPTHHGPGTALFRASFQGWHILPQHKDLRLSRAGDGCYQPDLLLFKPCREV